MVDLRTLNRPAISSTVSSPASYMRCAWSRWQLGELGGRPPVRPRARAEARPSRVPSTMASRSNSARAARNRKNSRPIGVVVSMPCSSTMKSTPCSSNQADRSSRCWWLRPMRRSRVTTTWSPRLSLPSSSSSRGREASLPEIFSITMLPGSIPAAASASCWESGFCSRVETRAYPYRVTAAPRARPGRAS